MDKGYDLIPYVMKDIFIRSKAILGALYIYIKQIYYYKKFQKHNILNVSLNFDKK